MDPRPKQVQVVKYGPDASSVASVGTASYGSKADSDSPDIRFVNQTADGKSLSNTTLSVNEAGMPSSAMTELYDPYDATVCKQINTDYSGLQWTTAMSPQQGGVKMTVTNQKNKKVHVAQFSFEGEQLRTVAIRHMPAGGNGNPVAFTNLDFSQVKIVGRRLVGGQINMVHRLSHNSLRAKSSLTLTEDGLASLLDVTTFKKDGITPVVHSQWDYSQVTFDARKKVYAGPLVVTNTHPDGTPRSTTVITMEQGQVIKMVTTLANGKVLVTQLKPRQWENTAEKPQVLASLAPLNVPGNPQNRTTVIKRPDGTVERSIFQEYVTQTAGGKELEIPVSAVIQDFATDGTTVVDRKEIHYGPATFNNSGGGVSGSVQVNSFFNDKKVKQVAVEYVGS